MANPLKIRQATTGDYDAIADVVFDAVRLGNSEYTEEQRQAWVPHPRSGIDWVKRLDSQTVFVATHSEKIVGFMSLGARGYIDFAYIHPSAQGTGVFRELYKSVENRSYENGKSRLYVHASLIAQPAFTAMGFVITSRGILQRLSLP